MKKFNYSLNVWGERKEACTRTDIIRFWGSEYLERLQKIADLKGRVTAINYFLGTRREIGVSLI